LPEIILIKFYYIVRIGMYNLKFVTGVSVLTDVQLVPMEYTCRKAAVYLT